MFGLFIYSTLFFIIVVGILSSSNNSNAGSNLLSPALFLFLSLPIVTGVGKMLLINAIFRKRASCMNVVHMFELIKLMFSSSGKLPTELSREIKLIRCADSEMWWTRNTRAHNKPTFSYLPGKEKNTVFCNYLEPSIWMRFFKSVMLCSARNKTNPI